jgi:hypothetical protein
MELVKEDTWWRLLAAGANAGKLIGLLVLPSIHVFQLVANEVAC